MDKNHEIEEINNQIARLKKEHSDTKKRIKYQTDNSYRKDRARRLIETGALAEKYFEIHNLTIEEREELFKIFSSFIQKNKPNKYKK